LPDDGSVIKPKYVAAILRNKGQFCQKIFNFKYKTFLIL